MYLILIDSYIFYIVDHLFIFRQTVWRHQTILLVAQQLYWPVVFWVKMNPDSQIHPDRRHYQSFCSSFIYSHCQKNSTIVFYNNKFLFSISWTSDNHLKKKSYPSKFIFSTELFFNPWLFLSFVLQIFLKIKQNASICKGTRADNIYNNFFAVRNSLL